MAYKKVTHVLFDMDGLLLDSEVLYTKAFNNILSRYGHGFAWDYKVTLLGMQGHEVAEKVIKDFDLPLTKEQFMAESQKMYEELFPNVTMLPGAKRLVEHLHDHNIPIALATSSNKDSAELKMTKHHDVFNLFLHKTMGSSDPEVVKGKPSPDIFLVCASRFTVPPNPEDCLVFEDAPNGVAAALAAGMQVVLVPDPQLDKELTKGATLVLSSLEDFKPELFGLPPFPHE